VSVEDGTRPTSGGGAGPKPGRVFGVALKLAGRVAAALLIVMIAMGGDVGGGRGAAVLGPSLITPFTTFQVTKD